MSRGVAITAALIILCENDRMRFRELGWAAQGAMAEVRDNFGSIEAVDQLIDFTKSM